MVKTPKMRHSKARKDPVTIDLEATRLSAAETGTEATQAAEDTPVDDATADTRTSGDTYEPAEAAVTGNPSGRPSDDVADAAQPRQRFDDQHRGFEEDAMRAPSGQVENAATATSPPPVSPQRRGGLSMVAAGIIGGVITLLGAGALQYGGLLPAPGSAGTPALDGLRAEITTLQSELATLKASGGDGTIQQTVASLQGTVDGLAGDLAALRSAVESGGAGENAGLAALDGKIAEIQSKLATLSEGGGTADLAPINEKITALDAAIRAATDTVAGSDTRMTALEQQLSELTGKLDAQGNQPKIALSIAASALKAAIDRGQPFVAELETLAAINPNLPQLAALRPHAEAGVATRDDLLGGIEAAASAMIAAGKPVDPDAGVFDQLWQSAASLVDVRPVGAVEGEGVPETVARMEAALKDGDLARTLAEYDSLPAAAKAAGSDLATGIKARLDVEALVDQAIAEAMKTV